MNKILAEAGKSFWEEVGRDVVKKGASTFVTEVIKANVDLWKQMKLKRDRRVIDLQFRKEDDAWKEKKAKEKKAQSAARTNTPPVCQNTCRYEKPESCRHKSKKTKKSKKKKAKH